MKNSYVSGCCSRRLGNLLLPLLVFAAASVATAQLKFSADAVHIFDRSGREVTMDALVTDIGASEAVFLGEQHDDAVGHAVQAEIFRRAVEKYKADRSLALSMEMFERDVQVVLDEYLAGLITESHFRSSSRPWPNYETDYRPLVETAKANSTLR